MSSPAAERFAGARVLVAGGAGFLGSHLVEALLAGGADVVVVDDLCTGDRANLASVVDHPRLSLIEADICRWSGPEGALDAVFHLASPASPVAYNALPLHTLRTGSAGTERLLELAGEGGVPLLLASTSEVYGDPERHPQREDYLGNVDPMGPRAMYDEAKRYAEALCSVYRAQGAAVRVARIFNTYGPRMKAGDGRVVPNFLAQAQAGEPLTVYGDGSQTRSFCYVSDLVEGLLRLAASDCDLPVNLGNPTEHTIVELAHTVLELTGARSELVFQPLPPGDPRRRRPEIGRAREVLGWEPMVALEEGLRRTLEG